MAKKVSIAIILLSALFIGCSPKYFAIPTDQKIVDTIGVSMDLSKSSHYRFIMTPYQYFKNNIQTTSSLSDSSTFMKQNLLFHLNPRDSVLDEGSHFIDRSWFKMDMFVVSQNAKPKEGDKVYIKTMSGKYLLPEEKLGADANNNIGKAKLMYLYFGEVGPTVQQNNPNNPVSLIYINNVYHITRGKTKHKVKDKRALAFTVDFMDEKISFESVIDLNYKKRSDKSVIYNLKDIFGEAIWMNAVQTE